MATATNTGYAVRPERGAQDAGAKTRKPEQPYAEDDSASRRDMLSVARSPEFENRNALCVVRDSALAIHYTERGIKKRAVLMTEDGRLFDIYDDHHKKGEDIMAPTLKGTGKTAAAGNLGSGVVDSNRFYSMLLDAKTASIAESMHDVADKLLSGEKDNAKVALDQLCMLKKTLTGDQVDDTLELLIAYYQDKMNALREREEHIKKVSRDTRSLVEEKKRKDEELSGVKAQISDCTRNIDDLNSKLEVLKKREEDLTRIDLQLRRDITTNERQIVDGLQEIILRQPDARFEPKEDPIAVELIKQAAAQIKKAPLVKEPVPEPEPKPEPKPKLKPEPKPELELEPINEPVAYSDDFYADNQINILNTENQINVLNNDTENQINVLNDEAYDDVPPMQYTAPAKEEALYHEPMVYPKSVVRMGGKIIGEYYHDGNIVTKEERHYIYNSRFMAEHLTAGLNVIKNRFCPEIHAELIKIVDDADNRVRENKRFHFEVSTNEIMNTKNMREVSASLRRRTWDDAEWFASRLCAKIEMLGMNYEAMLQEQMERCAEIG